MWDDHGFVESNQAIQHLRPVTRFFTDRTTLGPKENYHSMIYRPVRTMTFAVLTKVFGPNPIWFHLLNVLLHAGCALLVFEVSRRLGLAVPGAAVAAWLFAVHPIHVEAVAWVSSLGDVLSSFLYLLAFFLFVIGGLWRWFSVLMIVPLAMFSKEMAVTFPMVVLLWTIWKAYQGKSVDRGGYAAIGISFFWAVIYLVVRANVLGEIAQMPVSAKGVGLSLIRAPVVAAEYVRLFVWPHPLNAFRSSIPSRPIWWILCSISFLGIVAALLSSRVEKRLRIHLLFGVLSFCVLLSPVLQILPIAVAVAERFLYLPSVALCLVAGAGAEKIWTTPGSRKIYGFGAISVLLLLLGLTAARNQVWSDEIALFQDTLKQPNPSATVYWNLGTAAARKGQWDLALDSFLKQKELERPNSRVLNNLSFVYFNLKKYESAYEAARVSTTIDPTGARSYENAGAALLAMDRNGEAATYLERAKSLDPNSSNILVNLGLAELKLGRAVSARGHILRALELNPRDRAAAELIAQMSQK